MAEFKGTKGKWIITYPKGSNGFIYVGEKTNEGRIATCYTVDTSEWNQNITEETKANALLISKSPLLLKAIKDSITELREVGLNDMANYHEKLYNECVNL